MKFVCTECQEPMKFEGAGGLGQDGSLDATFRCPSCEWGVTMLINPQETQVVRSLGVKVGGDTEPAQPMQLMRSFLEGTHPTPDKSSSGGKCPFTQVVQKLDDPSS